MYNFNMTESIFCRLHLTEYIKVRVFHPKYTNTILFGNFYDDSYPLYVLADLNGSSIGKCDSRGLSLVLGEPLTKKFLNNICASSKEHYIVNNILTIQKHKILNFNYFNVDSRFRKYLEGLKLVSKRNLLQKMFNLENKVKVNVR